MKSSVSGQKAETAVAAHLKNQGFKIVVQNWRTPLCEVDLIASKDGIVYFVEVKYRSHDRQGDGFSYITPSKLRRMNFSAEIWVAENDWNGDYRLMAAAVDSSDYQILDIVEIN